MNTSPRRAEKGVLIFPSEAPVAMARSQSGSNQPPLSTSKETKRSRRRQYAAARRTRLTEDWQAPGTSADSELYGSLRTLRNRSRSLMRDDCYFKRAKSLVVNNVVFKGIGLQGQIQKLRGQGYDTSINDEVEKWWKYWCCKKRCDVSGRLSFNQMQRVIIGSFVESGEVLIRIHEESFGGSKVPFALEVIESDRLAEDTNGLVANSGNVIRMGVECDKHNRPVAYWIYPQHPGDYLVSSVGRTKVSPERIPADQVIHLYIPERPGQTRGVPSFAAGILKSRHLGLMTEAELIASRSQASTSGIVQTNDADLLKAGEDGEILESLEPGAIRYLAPGETFVGFDPTRPGGQFEPFVRCVIREMSAGLDLSYAALSQDYSQSNFSSARLSLLEDRGVWQVLQAWFCENFLQPVYELWLEVCWGRGLIALNGFEDEFDRQRYFAVRWKTRGWAWIDPLKEVNAAVRSIDNSLSTLTDELNAQGLDLEETLRTRKRELELAEQIGVDITPQSKQDPPKAASGKNKILRTMRLKIPIHA